MSRLAYRITAVLLVLSVAATVFFYMGVRERDRYLSDLIGATVRDAELESTTDVALTLSAEIHRRTNAVLEREELSLYDRLEALSPFNVTSATALKYGGFGIREHDVLGPCGTMSRTLLNALWALDIPARKLQLLANERGEGGGHTLLEYFDGERWCVLSPSDSTFVWRRGDGAIATTAEIRRDASIFSQIYERYPEYPYRFDNPSHIRWDKLPGPVQRVFRLALGEEGFRRAQTPRLYDRPRDLFLIASASVSLVLFMVLLLLRPRRPAPTRALPLDLIPV